MKSDFSSAIVVVLEIKVENQFKPRHVEKRKKRWLNSASEEYLP